MQEIVISSWVIPAAIAGAVGTVLLVLIFVFENR